MHETKCFSEAGGLSSGEGITLYRTRIRSIVNLACHVRPSLGSGIFSSGFPTKILYVFRVFRACCIYHPYHHPLFDHPLSNIW
jgi:hypothetical protein